MKSGFPSAVSSTRAVVAGARPRARLAISASQSASGRRSSRTRARVRLSAAPAGSLLEQLGTGDADEEDRRTPHPLRQVLDQVEEGGLGPVDVLEEDDEGPLPGERLEQAPGGPEDLLAIARRLRDADRLLEAVGERPRLVSRRRGAAPFGPAAVSWLTISRSDQKVMPSPYGTQRPTRTVASSAASEASSCASLDFPIPAVPRIVSRCSVRSRSRAFERLPELGELGLAADERRLQRSDRRPFAREVAKPPGGARLGLDPARPWRVRERAARSPRRGGSPRRRRRPRARRPRSSVRRRPTPAPAPEPLARTSPVAIPTRVAEPESIASRVGASRISSAADAARNASSSWTRGTPKTAITALPRLLAIVPP